MKNRKRNIKNGLCRFPNSRFQLLLLVLFVALLSGCVSFQVGGEIQAGRMALVYGDPNVALAHFQRAAELDPNVNFSLLFEGVWTYVGRAYYAVGKLPQARQAFERARLRYEEDHLAKLYLGLVLVRQGEREKGVSEINAGLTGLRDWLDYVDRYSQDGRFWDPGERLRSEIERALAMIAVKDINWHELIESGEWLGSEFEEEIDLAEQDRLEEQTEDGDDDDPTLQG